MNLPKNEPSRLLTLLLYTGIFFLGIYVLFKYLLFTVMPFALGLLLSFALSPAYRMIKSRTRLNSGVCAFILVSICTSFVLFVIYTLSVKLYYQAVSFVDNFSEGFIGDIMYNIPILSKIMSAAESVGVDIIKSFGDIIAKKAPSVIGGAAELFPKLIFFFTVFIFSSVYFLADYDKIKDFCKRKLPHTVFEKISKIKKKTISTVCGFLKGYFLIMLLTFGELLLGFFILGVDYALLIAAITAIVDILPILGVGSVLLPWALFAFAQGNLSRAVGLCVIFVIISAVRRFAEPAILGKKAGLHPLLSISCMYLGYNLFGVTGLLLFPPLATLIKEVVNDK